MDENAKTEQNLSEGQLQQIAGGCSACTRDINVAYDKFFRGIRHRQRSDVASNRGLHDDALHHSIKADLSFESARQAYRRVIARQAIPGHDIAHDAPPPAGS